MFDKSIAKEGQLLPPLLAKTSRQNDLVPISRLPPELMCRIFSHTQALYTLAYEPNPLEWIALTYVCRRWRNIAVNLPSLWVTPPIGNPKWVEEMLRRSKECSLVIKSNLTKIDSGIVPALQQIHRIRELSLGYLDPKTWNILREMFPKSVPQLERLCLVGDDHRGLNPIIIPEDILCETGRLSHLQLGKCQVNWTAHSHLLRSLTRLTLANMPRTSLPTGEQFASALKSMPELQVLTLSSLPTQTEQQSSRGSENMHFAHLHTLSISSGFVEAEAFFHWASFPPTAKVKLSLSHFDRAYPDFSGAIFALARSYSNTTPDTAFHSISQYSSRDDSITLRFFTKKMNIYEIARTPAIADLQLGLFCSHTPGADSEMKKLLIDVFNNTIPLDSIDCACIDEMGLVKLNIEMIEKTFGMLPRLRSIMVSGREATKAFLNVMHLGSHAGDIAGPRETPTQELYFRCVSSIALCNITFMHPEDSNTEFPYELTLKTLRDILTQRSERGGPIEMLLLWNCYRIWKKDIKLLEEVVVNIHCNVIEDDDPEDEEGEEGTEEDEEEETDEEGEADLISEEGEEEEADEDNEDDG